MKKTIASLTLLTASISAQATPVTGLLNGSFEDPASSKKTYRIMDASLVPHWETSASDKKIEIWSNGFIYNSFEGNQHIELNANSVGTLYQTTAAVTSGSELSFKFAHRGRTGVDTLRLTITDLGSDNTYGTDDDTALFSKQYSTGNNAWVQYTNNGEDTILSLGNAMRFAYASIATSGPNNSYGNLLDDVSFGSVSSVPVPAAFWMFGTGLVGFIGMRKKSVTV